MSEPQEKKSMSIGMKIMIGIGAAFALLIVIVVAGSFLVAPNFEKFQSKSKQAEARSLLVGLYTTFKMDWAEYGIYNVNSFETFQNEVITTAGMNSFYKVAIDPGEDPMVAKFCPDCGVTEEGFKALAYGNIDDDETIDAWTVDQDKNMVQVSDDISN
ncbi:MAG: hypothetical protein AAF202_04880 [Pseudomonadota bacterium]